MMKKTVLVALLAVTLSGCFGGLARDEVLMPAMALAYPGVAECAEVGIAADENLSAEDAAVVREQLTFLGTLIKEKNRDELLTVDWPALRVYAEKGVAVMLEREEIGPNGALSLLERILKFDEAYRKAVER